LPEGHPEENWLEHFLTSAFIIKTQITAFALWMLWEQRAGECDVRHLSILELKYYAIVVLELTW